MECVSGRVVNGWRDSWSGRSYRRLNGGRRRRMRVGAKIRISRISGRAKKMVLWMRDAYMRMMMRLAVSGVRGMSGADAVVGFGNPSAKEYDRNMILHIYNSLLVAPPHSPAPSLPPSHPISALSAT